MPVEYRTFITPEDCLAERGSLFLFGDNYLRKGTGGQAAIRGQPNAHGIRTKHFPDTTPQSYFNDDEFTDNCRLIDEDLLVPFHFLAKRKTVVIPRNIGNGLAQMEFRAPMTYAYFMGRMQGLVNFAIDTTGNT